MEGGYTGAILDVDLTDGMIRKRATDHYCEIPLFIGGKGFGAAVLWRELKPGVDTLSPENILLFLTGPLTGTTCPGTRMCVVTKSPLTDTFCDSYVGGHFGSEMKFAGYDAIIVRGRSEKPVYLWIQDKESEIRDAKHLWGLDTFQTEEKIREENGDRTMRVACIGPAGERLVKFALINTECYRQAGRGGTGAVMGSKNLKAIAVKGCGQIPIHDLDTFNRVVIEIHDALPKEENIRTRKRWGTARSVLFASDQDMYPTKNYREDTFEGAENLSAEVMEKRFWVKHKACHGCPVSCGKLGVIRSGTYAGTVVEGIEFETTALMGANCGIDNYEAVAHANMLCDMLGLDTISSGSVISFAMECFERGILTEKETDGLRLNFGNEETLTKLVKKIAYREGFGNFLAEGVKRMSERLGRGTQDFAMHVKGLELPGWGVRAAPGTGLAYATADRGGCHMRAWFINFETSGVAPDGSIIQRFSTEKRAWIGKREQDRGAAGDCLVSCRFLRGTVGEERYILMLNAATGMKITHDEFVQIGERVWNLTRMFNVREGFSRKDDTLPKRLLTEPLSSGVAKGQRLTQTQLNQMLDEYYELRGWNKNTGIPTKEKLRELKLDFVTV